MNDRHDRREMRIKQNIEINLSFALKELAEERELMKTKWFAYRFLSPSQATYKFTKLYVEHLERSVQTNRDRNMKVKGIDWVDYWKRGPEFTRCWRARKRADQFCIPYELYLSQSFHFASRRKRRFEPQINQLQGGENSAGLWLIEFEKLMRERLWPSLVRLDMPQYHVDHYMDLPPQRDYREFILATASDASLVTTPWKRIIERYSYIRNEIPSALFRNHMKSDVYNECVDDLAYEAAQGRLVAASVRPLAKHERWLSCFGVPECRDTNSSMCANCPLSAHCQKVSVYVQSAVEATTGSVDPVREARLASQNARKARSRAKQKVLSAGTSI